MNFVQASLSIVPSTILRLCKVIRGSQIRMGFLLLVTRIVLAAVFAVASVAKLTNFSASLKAVEDFGLSNSPATPIGSALPFVDVTTAGLLPLPLAWWED